MTDHDGHYLADIGPCPACGAEVDCHAAMRDDGAGPVPGAVLICFYCATPALVGDDGRQRPPTAREASELALDPVVVQARGAVLADIRGRRRGQG